MAESSAAGLLLPLAHDLPAAVRLATEAIEHAHQQEPLPIDPGPRIAYTTEGIRAATLHGRLYVVGEQSAGIVLWDEETPPSPGLHLHMLHLSGSWGSVNRYGRMLDDLRRLLGPVMFLPADLAGLAPPVEAELMRGRGFARFGRSEMRIPIDVAVPEAPPPPTVRVRPIRRTDQEAVARAHSEAFAGHFDAYMFCRDPDPRRSSEREIDDVFRGRWGELIWEASLLAETPEGRPCGMALFVRAPYGALLITVGVQAPLRGSGLGKSLICRGIRTVRDLGIATIALNVTEGNRGAIGLYERLGFVRSIGPEWGWFSTELVPVGPDGLPTRPQPGNAPGASPPPGGATPRNPPA